MKKIIINNKEYTLKKIAEALSCNIENIDVENIDKLYVAEKLEEKRKEKNRLRTTKNRILKKN
jgi:diaminopimelate decarboxylase